MAISKFFLFLILYSFAGWILEVSYNLWKERKISNQGFLIGPICPIYGTGCMMMVMFFSEYKNNILLIFSAALVLLSALEYSTSWFLEKMFKIKWWDYSKAKFNLNGRICLFTSVSFGLLSILIVSVIHPFLLLHSSGIPLISMRIAAVFFFIASLVDFIFTLIIMARRNDATVEQRKFEDEYLHTGDQRNKKSRYVCYRTERNAWFK